MAGEPFLPHTSHTECFVCMTSAYEGDAILFKFTQGGHASGHGEYRDSGAPTQGQTYEYAKTISKFRWIHLGGLSGTNICAIP